MIMLMLETNYVSVGLFQKLSSGRGRQRFFLSGGWMQNNVKFVLRDEDIQVNIIRRLVGGNNSIIIGQN